jgi:hypothetical protein
MRYARSLITVALLAACHPTHSDLEQYDRMQAQDASTRSGETIRCNARDILCVRLSEMHGSACAQRANDARLAPVEGGRLRRCAMDEARSQPALLPINAPPEDRERAVRLVYDAWRTALDGGDIAADTSSIAPAIDSLNGMAGGAPYAAALTTYAATLSVQTGRTPLSEACAVLSAAHARLPAAGGTSLQGRIDDLRAAIEQARDTRRCQ